MFFPTSDPARQIYLVQCDVPYWVSFCFSEILLSTRQIATIGSRLCLTLAGAILPQAPAR